MLSPVWALPCLYSRLLSAGLAALYSPLSSVICGSHRHSSLSIFITVHPVMLFLCLLSSWFAINSLELCLSPNSCAQVVVLRDVTIIFCLITDFVIFGIFENLFVFLLIIFREFCRRLWFRTLRCIHKLTLWFSSTSCCRIQAILKPLIGLMTL